MNNNSTSPSNPGVIYGQWPIDTTSTMMDLGPNSVTTSVYSQNVELQNCRNSMKDTAQFFCGRFVRSRLLILIALLVAYTFCGAFLMRSVEMPAELAEIEARANRLRERRNDLVDRIVALRRAAGGSNQHHHDTKLLANLTFASLSWYESDITGTKSEKRSPEIGGESYWSKLLLLGASVSTIGFRFAGPHGSLARCVYALVTIPGVLLYVYCAWTVGQGILYDIYEGVVRCFRWACTCCRPRYRPRSRLGAEYWRDRLSWTNLLPYVAALAIVAAAQTAIFHAVSSTPSSFSDTVYHVILATFTVGAPPIVTQRAPTQFDHALLIVFAFVWLAHAACLYRAAACEKGIFARFLFAWLQQNKEDAIFIKLSLLQPTVRRRDLADMLMVKCARGSIYRKLLYRTLTLEEKVQLCRHLSWINEPQQQHNRVVFHEAQSISTAASNDDPSVQDEGVQVDFDDDPSLM